MPCRRRSRPPKPIDDESSEDELAAAEVDNTPIHFRQSIPPADDIIDLTDSPPSSPALTHRGRPPSQPSRMQSGACSRGRSQSKPPVPAAAKRARVPDRPPSPEQVLQLLTPPRSSSAVESTPDTQQDYSPASRAETPSPKFPKARLRYTPRPRTPSEDGDDGDGRLPSLDTGERTGTRHPFPVGPPKKAKKKPLPAKPEVVIMTSPRRFHGRPISTRSTSTEPASSPSMATVGRKSAKGKGKEAGPPEPSSSVGASRVSRSRRSQSQPRGLTRESTEEFSSPQPRPPSKGTKRRRVSSLSSLSDGSPAQPVSPEPPPTASRSVREHHNTRNNVRSSHSSDVGPPTSSPVRADDEDGTLRRPSDRTRMLRRVAQKKSLPSSLAVTAIAPGVSLLLQCHNFSHYTRTPTLRIPHDIMTTPRRRVAIGTIQHLTNDIRRFLNCQTRRHNTLWPRRGTVSRISWLRARSTRRHLRPAPATLLVFLSHPHPGRHTPTVIADTTPSHPMY